MKYFIPIITRQFIGNVTWMEQMIKIYGLSKSYYKDDVCIHYLAFCELACRSSQQDGLKIHVVSGILHSGYSHSEAGNER